MIESAPTLPIQVESGLLKKELDHILYSASLLGASDVSIQSGDYVVFMISGKQVRASSRVLLHFEVESVVNILYEGPNGVSMITQGEPIDKRYEIHPGRGIRVGFRVNILPARIDGNDRAIAITLRVLPKNPPEILTMSVPKEIVLNSLPRNGLVTISGVTSSGKSTLIASLLRYAYELKKDTIVTACGRKIATYEAPIEYIYDGIDSLAPKISQTEIGGIEGLRGWNLATETAMRRALQIILIGECRDSKTMDGCIDMANTGQATLTTLHAGSVGGSFRRMVSLSMGASDGTASVGSVSEKLLGALRLMIVQALAPKESGGRLALREWVVVTKTLQDRLFDFPAEQIARELQREVVKRGTSLGHSALFFYQKGELSLANACAFSGLTKQELLAIDLDESVFDPFISGSDEDAA